jgi:protein-S-isoprenylcysteine O-methyltransferase Ste14
MEGIMIYLATSTGILGFLIINLFDFVSLKRIAGAKLIVWITGSSLIIFSLILICLTPNKLPLPAWSIRFGWGLLSASLFLLIYSLFINLPFRKTYVNTGIGDKLITTGLYALVRHPWIHCFILFLLSLVLISRSSLLLLTAPIFILLNILLSIVQDKFVFTKMFDTYDDYKRKTPMLIPNRRSISAFINSVKQTKSEF